MAFPNLVGLIVIHGGETHVFKHFFGENFTQKIKIKLGL
jgi:hypothetical protein